MTIKTLELTAVELTEKFNYKLPSMTEEELKAMPETDESTRESMPADTPIDAAL